MDACVFYDSCSVLDECEDCYTESLGCYDFCAASVEGALGDNIISVLGGNSIDLSWIFWCGFGNSLYWQ